MSGILNDVGIIDSLVLYGFGFCCAVVLAEIFGKRELKIYSITVSTKIFPFLAVVLTGVHGFLTIRLIDKISHHDPRPDNELWTEIVNGKSWIFNGMKPREPERFSVGDWVFFSADTAANDFAFYASIAFATSLLLALTFSLFPYLTQSFRRRLQSNPSVGAMDFGGDFDGTKNDTVMDRILKIGVILLIVITNWILGSNWAIQISSLHG